MNERYRLNSQADANCRRYIEETLQLGRLLDISIKDVTLATGGEQWNVSFTIETPHPIPRVVKFDYLHLREKGMNPILATKEELKRLVGKIRYSKYELGHHPAPESRTFRHLHIAYCELRGRTREQIESHTLNPPCEWTIKSHKDRITKELEAWKNEREQENVCAG